MKNFAIEHIVMVVIVGFVGLVFTLAVGGYWTEAVKCNSINRLTGEQTDTTVSLGCMVKRDGRWISGDSAISNTREITVTK